MGLLTFLKHLMIQGATKLDTCFRYIDFRLNRSDPEGWWQKNVPVAPRQSPTVVPVGAVVLLAVTNGPLLVEWRGFGTLAVVVAALVGLLFVLRGAERHAKPLWLKVLAGWKGWLPLLPWLGCVGFALAVLFSALSWDFDLGFVLLGLGIVLGLFGAAATPRGVPALLGWLIFLGAGAVTWFVLAGPDSREATGGVPYRNVLTPVSLLVVFFGLPFSRWWAWFLFRDHRRHYRDAFLP